MKTVANFRDLVVEARSRDYHFDHILRQWYKWEEFGEVAIEVFLDKQYGPLWRIYGPDDRRGFFSVLYEGSNHESMAHAEACAEGFYEELNGLE